MAWVYTELEEGKAHLLHHPSILSLVFLACITSLCELRMIFPPLLMALMDGCDLRLFLSNGLNIRKNDMKG